LTEVGKLYAIMATACQQLQKKTSPPVSDGLACWQTGLSCWT